VDLNPTGKGHWTFKLWFKNIEPQSLLPLQHTEKYAKIWMSPYDNKENLAEGYIEDSLEVLTGDQRTRFLEGQYQDDDILLVFRADDSHYFDSVDFQRWVEGRLSEVRMVGGLDVGFQDADAFSIIAYIDGDNTAFILYEYKSFREELADLAAGIRKGLNYIATEFPWYQNPQILPIYSDTNTIRFGKEGEKKKNWGELKRIYGFNTMAAFKRDKSMHVEFMRTLFNSGNLKIRRASLFDDETEQIVWHKNPIDGTIEHIIDDEVFHPDLMFAIMYAINYILTYGNKAWNMQIKQPESAEPMNTAIEAYQKIIHEKEEQEEQMEKAMEMLSQDGQFF
jgi:hypothetical protein